MKLVGWGKYIIRRKKGKFFCTWAKKISFFEKGGGAKISYFGEIYTPALLSRDYTGQTFIMDRLLGLANIIN